MPTAGAADAEGAFALAEGLITGGGRGGWVGVVCGTCGTRATAGGLPTAGGFIPGEDEAFGAGVAAATFGGGGLLTGFSPGATGRTPGVDGSLAFGFSFSWVGASPALNVGCRDIGSLTPRLFAVRERQFGQVILQFQLRIRGAEMANRCSFGLLERAQRFHCLLERGPLDC